MYRKPVIVLLDDDQDDRDLLLHIYQSYAKDDIELHILKTGEEFLLFLMNMNLPDLIILDQNMPRVTGLEILAKLKKTPGYKDLSVVLFSTVVDDMLCQTAFKLGAKGVFEKPVYYKDLVEVFLCILYYAEECNQGVKYFPE